MLLFSASDQGWVVLGSLHTHTHTHAHARTHTSTHAHTCTHTLLLSSESLTVTILVKHIYILPCIYISAVCVRPCVHARVCVSVCVFVCCVCVCRFVSLLPVMRSISCVELKPLCVFISVTWPEDYSHHSQHHFHSQPSPTLCLYYYTHSAFASSLLFY